jgi:hypothetical protein
MLSDTVTVSKSSEPQLLTKTETSMTPSQVGALVQVFSTWRQGWITETVEDPVSGTVWLVTLDLAPQKEGWSVCGPGVTGLASRLGRLSTCAVKRTAHPAFAVPGEVNRMGLLSWGVNVTTPSASGGDISNVLPLQALQNPVPAPVQQLKGLLMPTQSVLLPPVPVALNEKTLSGFEHGKVTLPH